MRIVEKIIRLSFSVFLLVASGDIFFRYFDLPEPPKEAQEFLISLTATGYVWPSVGLIYLVTAILLPFKRLVGLALVLLFPVTINVFLFTVFLDPALTNSYPEITLCLLHLVLAGLNHQAFRSLIGR